MVHSCRVYCDDPPCNWRTVKACKKRAVLYTFYPRRWHWMCKASSPVQWTMQSWGVKAIDWYKTSLMGYKNFMERLYD